MGRQFITKVPASSLYVSKPMWWLKSRFHFAFAEHFTGKQAFGCLRVLNDDLVQPHAGFGRHGHRDAEIFSYVVRGELSHEDSIGNKEALPRGSIQYLSAGTGISHSEMNDSAETCRFLQVWLTPDKPGHTPQYGSRRFAAADRAGGLLHVLGGTGAAPRWDCVRRTGEPIRLNQDANVFVSENEAGAAHAIALGAARQAYLVCIEGSMAVEASGAAAAKAGGARVELAARDAAEIVASGKEPLHLALEAGSDGAHFMLIEMAGRPWL